MEHDHNYSKLLNIMRKQGSKDNPTTLLLGVMQSEDSVKIGDLILKKEDLYISSNLPKSFSKELVTPYVSSVKLTVEGIITKTEEVVEMKEGLKKGDIVAVMKLNNNNTYAILAKVVKA